MYRCGEYRDHHRRRFLHGVTASQAGDGNYNPAPSVSQTFSIARAATTVTVTSSLSPSTVGQSVTFTATVVPTTDSAIPSGSVTFTDGRLLQAKHQWLPDGKEFRKPLVYGHSPYPALFAPWKVPATQLSLRTTAAVARTCAL